MLAAARRVGTEPPALVQGSRQPRRSLSRWPAVTFDSLRPSVLSRVPRAAVPAPRGARSDIGSIDRVGLCPSAIRANAADLIQPAHDDMLTTSSGGGATRHLALAQQRLDRGCERQPSHLGNAFPWAGPELQGCPILGVGYFGASTGGAAALVAAAERTDAAGRRPAGDRSTHLFEEPGARSRRSRAREWFVRHLR